ncbi:hypothetical protein BDR04DRAFT_261502 [Suillus decipiens]|nr:hypothetical protein BDR04DRAFT_261502 [Suillus decipiens]
MALTCGKMILPSPILHVWHSRNSMYPQCLHPSSGHLYCLIDVQTRTLSMSCFLGRVNQGPRFQPGKSCGSPSGRLTWPVCLPQQNQNAFLLNYAGSKPAELQSFSIGTHFGIRSWTVSLEDHCNWS